MFHIGQSKWLGNLHNIKKAQFEWTFINLIKEPLLSYL